MLAVTGVCFVSPIVHTNLFVGFGALVYNLMGYAPVRITHYTLLGCFPKHWMYVVSFFAQVAFTLTLAGAGFALSRKGHSEKKVTWLLVGAFLLYPIANRLFWYMNARVRGQDMLWFMNYKADFDQKPVPLFGNFYNFRFGEFCINMLVSAALYALAYWVITRYWPSLFRLQMLTVGALACIGGWVFWHMLLGPILY
ncbi:hypothetical protein [Rudanella paleaurantiibacter]|nr:hypothetical protein [Rudanella paleaurantiibacter]